MATEVESPSRVEFELGVHHWASGIVAGVLASAVFGAMIGAEMMEMIAVMVGQEGAAVGWVVHLIIGSIFAVEYVAIVSLDQLAESASRPVPGGGIGAIYGVAVWLVDAVVLMALLMEGAFMLNLDWSSFVGHVVWGVTLGALYPVFVARE